jgi:hypothetical protein
MGKSRPVCAYYISAPPEAAGACTRPDHFMCEHWMKQQRTMEKKKKGDSWT